MGRWKHSTESTFELDDLVYFRTGVSAAALSSLCFEVLLKLVDNSTDIATFCTTSRKHTRIQFMIDIY